MKTLKLTLTETEYAINSFNPKHWFPSSTKLSLVKLRREKIERKQVFNLYSEVFNAFWHTREVANKT